MTQGVSFYTPMLSKKPPYQTSIGFLFYPLSHQLNHLARLIQTGITVADYIAVMMAQSAPPSGKTSDLRSVHTSNLPELFDQLGISLIVSTYQAGKAIVVRSDNGRLNTHFRTFSKPTGIVADPTRLTIGGANTVWEYRNMPALAKKLARESGSGLYF